MCLQKYTGNIHKKAQCTFVPIILQLCVQGLWSVESLVWCLKICSGTGLPNY